MRAGVISERRANAYVCHFARIVALLLVVSISSLGVMSQDPKNDPAASGIVAATCPFCLSAFRTKDDFCSKCGRLARLTATSAEHRFWGDAVYADFDRFGDLPKLEAQLASDGLVREVVTFVSGGRVEMSKGKKGFVITGKVGGSAVSKEDSYSATMSAKLDGDGRLIQRSIWAKRNGDPDMYLYRVIEYRYSPDGLLDQITFDTKRYLSASDWDKHPAGWIKHSAGEILMARQAGTLRGIETRLQTFKRSLRGDPEPGETTSMHETVRRSGELVDAVVPAVPPTK